MSASHRSEREGPALTDERGELKEPYWGCQGCRWLRVNDGHYFYCRDLGDKTQPDFVSTYTGGMKRLWTYPRPHRECRFMPATESAP